MLADAATLPTLDAPLHAPRVRLRWLRPDDAPALWTIFGDPQVCRYWSSPPLANEAAAAALRDGIAAHFAARTLFQWGIARRDDDRVIGTCTLANLEAEHRRASVGYALAREHWGRGYAAEALPVLLDFAFGVAPGALALHRLEADADPRNAASVRVLERLGFRREGLQRERYFMYDEVQDALLFGLLAREWAAARAAP